MKVQSFPYKCTYCGRSGKYKTGNMALAMDFKCPHDGATMIYQAPATPMVEVFELPEVVEEMVEFTHKLDDAIVRRLGI